MTKDERTARIKQLIAKYPEPWEIVKEPHNYNDGTTEFTHVYYKSQREFDDEPITIMIGNCVTPDLAELLVLLRESANDLPATLGDLAAANKMITSPVVEENMGDEEDEEKLR
jgi:hypothetical protein